jgi:hypothetical protein
MVLGFPAAPVLEMRSNRGASREDAGLVGRATRRAGGFTGRKVRPAHTKVKLSCPATRHGGAWGERRYSSYSFLTSALDGGERSASRPGRALPPGKGLPVPIEQEAGWAPEPVWTQRLEEKSSASVEDRTPVVQSMVRHYTD